MHVHVCCAGGYASNSELLDALMAGAHIPLTSDGFLCARFRGHRYIDSGQCCCKPLQPTVWGGLGAMYTGRMPCCAVHAMLQC
jgi:hypothetical protein